MSAQPALTLARVETWLSQRGDPASAGKTETCALRKPMSAHIT